MPRCPLEYLASVTESRGQSLQGCEPVQCDVWHCHGQLNLYEWVWAPRALECLSLRFISLQSFITGGLAAHLCAHTHTQSGKVQEERVQEIQAWSSTSYNHMIPNLGIIHKNLHSHTCTTLCIIQCSNSSQGHIHGLGGTVLSKVSGFICFVWE